MTAKRIFGAKGGFTMVELIVVVAMIMILAGSVSSSVGAAHRRAKIQQAITVAQEMTNAILAYENYGKPGNVSPLDAKVTGEDNWKDCTQGDLKFILGQEPMPDGQEGNVPVLFNAAVTGDRILDPWKNVYRYKIAKGNVDQESTAQRTTSSAVAFPNLNRIPADEVQ